MASVNTESPRDRAATTRKKIIRAAHQEFLERGFHGATVAAIARRAGVASQTVYFIFHTKAALISAVVDDAVMGDDAPVLPQESEWWAAMVSADSAEDSLRAFVRGAASLFARASAISDIMRAAALTDSEVKATYLQHEALRAAGFREVVDLLATKGRLRAGLTPETATDAFLVAFGDTTYALLVSERGWSHDQAIAWFCEVLPNMLLAPE